MHFKKNYFKLKNNTNKLKKNYIPLSHSNNFVLKDLDKHNNK